MPLSQPTSYSPRVAFELELKRFRISTACDQAELREAQGLRHDVFCVEWQGRPRDDGLDADPLDPSCDHILVRDSDSGLLVGTFRLNPVAPGGPVYSSHEFQLDDFLRRLPGPKVEMGRACIRPQHRSNLTVIALYHGVTRYLAEARPRWLFGCSSVMVDDPARAADVAWWLRRQGHEISRCRIEAQPDAVVAGFREQWRQRAAAPSADAGIEALLPPLLRTYLRAGAKVAVEPAWDPDFRCCDFFTLFDVEQGNAGFLQRYGAG